MWLFVGLGNPGQEYRNNRHNIGFEAVRAVQASCAGFASGFKAKFQGEFCEGRLAAEKVGFLLPMTYMNLSGQSVGECARFYKINTDRIVVFHDELDLPPGEVRVKKGGGNAGHNGLKSIEAHLGTPDFWRVRIGIGHPGDKNRVSDYVLSDFAKADQEWIEAAMLAFSDTAGSIVTDGPSVFESALKAKLKS